MKKWGNFAARKSSFRHSSFVIRHSSFVIRHSSFVIRHSSFVIGRHFVIKIVIEGFEAYFKLNTMTTMTK